MEKKKIQNVKMLCDPQKMLGLFTAEDVRRSWKEDLVDEDTGEMVTVDRNEMIVRKGTMIDVEVAAKLDFSMQAGELEAVACSHECRAGKLAMYEGLHQYNAKVKLLKKKMNVLLWAQKVSQAFDVLVNWFELNHTGDFVITSISETDNGAYLKDDSPKDPNEVEESKIYSIKISMLTSDGEKEGNRLIVAAPNVDRAESIIAKRLEEMNGSPIEFMLEEVKVTSIDVIIPVEFTKAYTEGYDGSE